MKAYMLMTKSGPIVVLTSHASILDAFLLEKLADKGIEKFIASRLRTTIVVFNPSPSRLSCSSALVGFGGACCQASTSLRRFTEELLQLDDDGSLQSFRF